MDCRAWPPRKRSSHYVTHRRPSPNFRPFDNHKTSVRCVHITMDDVALSFVVLCEPHAAKIPDYRTTSERSLDNPWAQITHMSNRCLTRWRSQHKNMADTVHDLEMDVEDIITTDEWVWCITLYVVCMRTISGYKVITTWIIFRWWVLTTRLQNDGKRQEIQNCNPHLT